MDEPEIEDGQERFPATYLAQLRSECRARRLECREAEQQVKDLQAELEVLQSGPSEELLEARESLAMLERQIADMEDAKVKHGILEEAERLGFRNPTDAYRLLDDLDGDTTAGLRKIAQDNPEFIKPLYPPPPTPGEVITRPPNTRRKLTASEEWLMMLKGGLK
jgi:hypothetical protein